MDVSYEHAGRAHRALINFLAHAGVLDMVPDPLPVPICAATPLEGVEPIAAPHAGVLVFLRALGEKVEAGDAIADIIEPVSGKRTTLHTKVAGVFFARTAHRHLLRGMQVGKIAGPVAFRAGKLLSQ
jgi:predicted deacylase